MEKHAVLLTESTELLFFLREKLRTFSWTVTSLPWDLAALLTHIQTHPVSAVILDDTPENPALVWAQALSYHPLIAGYPLVPLLLEAHHRDRSIYLELGLSHLVDKPVSSEHFLSIWKEWEQEQTPPLMQQIQTGIRAFSAKSPEAAWQAWEGLPFPPDLAHLPGYKHLLQGDPRRAEKELLLCAKAERRTSRLLAVAEFYLRVQMPHLALQFFSFIENRIEFHRFLGSSIAQAHILLGDYESAILSLEKYTQMNYFRSASLTVLGHLLYARNRREEVGRMLQEDVAAYSKVKRTWSQTLGHR